MLARHAAFYRGGDALHRGDALEGIVADRGLLGEHEDRCAVEDGVGDIGDLRHEGQRLGHH